MKFRQIAAAAWLVALSGCASVMVDVNSAAPVPQNRVKNEKLVVSAPDKVGVTFVRDAAAAGVLGAACRHDVYVGPRAADGDPSFIIYPGEKLTINLPPGPHSFLIEQGRNDICPSAISSASTVLVAGAPETYRIMVPKSGDVTIARWK